MNHEAGCVFKLESNTKLIIENFLQINLIYTVN